MTPCGHLACEPLHALIKKRFEHTGGVKISAKGVVSSAARFDGSAAGREEAAAEVAHEWRAKACYTIARGGGLEVLKHARAQGCPWNEP